VIHPLRYQVENNDLHDELDHLRTLLKRESVPVCDLVPQFIQQIPRDKIDEYFWKLDGHCTKMGYEVFAKGLVSFTEAFEGFPKIKTLDSK
jgi:hypothetical protein